MAQYKAISQNLMHEDIKVTDEIYAWFNSEEIKEQIMSLSFNHIHNSSPDDELISHLKSLSKGGLQEAISISARLLANI